jgi:hypothetical protein
MNSTLTTSTAIALTAVLTTVLTMAAVCPEALAVAGSKPTYLLQSSRKVGQIDQVETLLEAGGDVTEVADGKVQPEKMSVVCKLKYQERTLETPASKGGCLRSVRYYDTTDAVVKVGQKALKPQLRPERRLIAAKIDAGKATLFSPRGPLSRDELELVEVQGNSLLLERFLPDRPVAVGDTWEHPAELMAVLLGLDHVAETDARSKLAKVTDTSAVMELSGRVEGAIYGVSTDVKLLAKYRFDRRRRRIDWFALLVKERRNSSPVIDGVDVVARVQVKIAPKASSAQLAEAALKGLPLQPSAELEQLSYQSDAGGWRFTHDRRWHVFRDLDDLAVLRMMDRGKLIAQCNVSPLPQLVRGDQITFDRFQSDIRQALDKTFGEFVEASQGGNDANYRVYRVVVRGEVSELPMQWNYYLVADKHGHQVVFAFTVEVDLVEQFGNADRELVGSLRFLPKGDIAAQ